MVALDAIGWDEVGEEPIQSCSLSPGRDCIVLHVYSYLLEHQGIQRGYRTVRALFLFVC